VFFFFFFWMMRIIARNNGTKTIHKGNDEISFKSKENS